MFEKIKNIFGLKEVSKKGYGDYDHNLGGYTFFGDIERAGKIRKSDLINLFTGYSYVCISAISEGIAGLDRKVFWSANRIDREKKHKYNDLITNSFLEEVVGFLEITGTCYIRKKMFGKSIDSLEVLRTDLVSRRSNGTYDYNYNGTIYNYSDEEVFIIKNFSPFKNGLGFSPLEALGKQQAMDDEIIDWNWSFFKNNASTGTTLQTDQTIDREKKEYLVGKWKSEFMGAKNANKVAILDNGLKEVKNDIGQKDMDFVNQRVMIRDEIFTIFRVPKVIVGITDGIGYTDRMVGKTTFAEFKLKPIAKKIEEALNKNIFKGIGFFRFINIVPIDTEQLAEDYRLGAISLNEYRIKRNYEVIKDGNKNISGEVLEIEDEKKKKEEKKDFGVEKVLEKVVKEFVKKDNDEVLQKRWEKKIKRTDIYEKKFSVKMKQIFDLQEKNILKKLKEKYKKKDFSFKKEDEEDVLPAILYLILYQKYFNEFYFDMLKTEGQIAISEVGNYQLNIEKIKKLVGENIKKFATEIDTTTKKEILQIIKDNLALGNPYIDMETAIKQRFNQFRKDRVGKIARTETTRAVNKARVEAWKQAGSVKEKEWWTSPDERGCDYCKTLHGQKVKIGGIFAKNDYEDISGPPYHPNCRCDLVPILE